VIFPGNKRAGKLPRGTRHFRALRETVRNDLLSVIFDIDRISAVAV